MITTSPSATATLIPTELTVMASSVDKFKSCMPTHPLPSPKALDDLIPIKPNDAIADYAETWKQANAADIKLAKRRFFGRLLELGLSAVSLGLAIAVTVTTGGLGAPLIAFATLGVVISVADAGCAFSVWHAKKHGKDSLLTGLPMGDDAIANVVFKLCQRFGVNKEHSVTASIITSYIIRVGVSVATLLFGAFVVPPSTMGTGALGLACTLADPISKALSIIVRGLISNGWVDAHKIQTWSIVQKLLDTSRKNHVEQVKRIATLQQAHEKLRQEHNELKEQGLGQITKLEEVHEQLEEAHKELKKAHILLLITAEQIRGAGAVYNTPFHEDKLPKSMAC